MNPLTHPAIGKTEQLEHFLPWKRQALSEGLRIYWLYPRQRYNSERELSDENENLPYFLQKEGQTLPCM